ncbi:MAG: hypothetical protein AMJ69_01205 [Gammaproteobacteria bacterium SG8_47]|nr:MAG: hypothetical protein AMJ69_01205 [Gammaproteobacteria bacterium SG8_47]
MITITPAAAKQIRESAKQGQMEGLPLRIAATRQPDGSIQYAMGFDDTGRDNDMRIQSEGIDVVVSPVSDELLQGTTLDYVELEPGRVEFIFLNPNDPNYTPPTE